MKLNIVILALLGHTSAVNVLREKQGADAFDSFGDKNHQHLATHLKSTYMPTIEKEQDVAQPYQYHEAELSNAQKKLMAYM